jgi:transcriptional regulator with XRE-family HTH domain
MAAMHTMGGRIREERQRLGLTVRGFARDIGVQPPYVTDIEADRRRPGPEVLGRISEKLKIPLPELQALDPRIPREVKEWMEDEPRVSRLLRRLEDSPDRDDLLRQIEEVVSRDDEGELES